MLMRLLSSVSFNFFDFIFDCFCSRHFIFLEEKKNTQATLSSSSTPPSPFSHSNHIHIQTSRRVPFLPAVPFSALVLTTIIITLPSSTVFTSYFKGDFDGVEKIFTPPPNGVGVGVLPVANPAGFLNGVDGPALAVPLSPLPLPPPVPVAVGGVSVLCTPPFPFPPPCWFWF
jgi:hypothetical protein